MGLTLQWQCGYAIIDLMLWLLCAKRTWIRLLLISACTVPVGLNPGSWLEEGSWVPTTTSVTSTCNMKRQSECRRTTECINTNFKR